MFPGDADMRPVPQCTTGRVLLLQFKNNRKEFFWMQEPKEDRDEEYCKTVSGGVGGCMTIVVAV